MNFILILGILSMVVCIHELGHAIAMYRRGVPLKTFSIGIEVRGIPCFSFRLKRFGGLRCVISPLLIGGYVEPDVPTDYWASVPYKDLAVIMGGGVMANFVSGAIFGALAEVFNKKCEYGIHCPLVSILIITAILFALFRRFICRYLLILIGFTVIYLLCWGIFTGHAQESVGGPVAIFQIGQQQLGQQQFTQEPVAFVSKIFEFSFVISLGISIINLMPVLPLDGGRIMGGLLRKFKVKKGFVKIWERGGIIFFTSLVIFILVSDVFRLFR